MLLSSLLVATASSAESNNIAQSLAENGNVKSVKSCFDDHRSTYQGFLDSIVVEQKQNYGRMANHLTVEKLSRMFPEKKYQATKKNVTCLLITYQSSDAEVEGFLVAAKNIKEPQPLVVFNRGGNGDFGKQSILQMLRQMPLVKQGAIVVGSQYRKQDEFGGKDIQDVHQLIDIAKTLPQVKPGNIDMIGVSRGGMTSYMVAKERNDIDSLVIWAGNSDLEKGLTIRPEMENVYQQRIPNYENDKAQQLFNRSAIKWVDSLDKNIRILLLHGDKDKRVNVVHATDMDKKLTQLDREHKLVVYKGGDHGLRKYQKQVNQEISNWIFTPSVD